MFQKFLEKKRIAQCGEIEDSIMTITQKEEATIEVPFERRSLSVFWYLIVIVILGLFARVFYLDFFQGAYYAKISKGNSTRSITIKAPRGTILDKYGKILARNIPSIDAIVIPKYLPTDPAARKDMADALADILGMNSGNTEIMLLSQDAKSLNPVLFKENISQDQALIIAEKRNEFLGIELEKTAIRQYENGEIFSPILGYDGKITQKELANNSGYLMTDYIGKSGLEKSYEEKLHGTAGATQVEVDSMGSAKRIVGVINPIPGNDLILNIDSDLQKEIYDSLKETLDKTGTKTAAAVAIDPRTGGVLALVSIPSYDNNLFAKGITNDEFQSLMNDSELPLLNRAITGEYPPGSTIKPAIAIGALSEKTITQGTIISGLGGALHVGAWSFRDWKVHDPSDVKMAIAQSNDIFFYTIGGGYGSVEGLGMSRMKKYYNLFGMGSLTGIDLPGEVAGFIPDEQWKLDKIGEKWYIGDSYHAAIGQGFVTVTPIQLANYIATIANGGTLYSPRLVNRVKSNGGQGEIVMPHVIRSNFIDADVMQTVREGMRLTVTGGTAQALKTLPVEAAGKTGTAQFGSEGKTHSWFAAFAPFDHPTIAIVVLMPGGGEGNSAALPVAQKALESYFSEKK